VYNSTDSSMDGDARASITVAARHAHLTTNPYNPCNITCEASDSCHANVSLVSSYGYAAASFAAEVFEIRYEQWETGHDGTVAVVFVSVLSVPKSAISLSSYQL